jgi:hypothetical protein
VSDRDSDAPEIDASVAELLTQLGDISRAVREYGDIATRLCDELVTLLAGRTPAASGNADGALGSDVLEIATLEAQTMGVSVADYLRDAVLAYRPDPATDGHNGSRAARRKAARLRAETRALTAQGAQAIAHTEELHARTTMGRDADRDGDGAGNRSGSRPKPTGPEP